MKTFSYHYGLIRKPVDYLFEQNIMGTSEKCFTKAIHTTLIVMFSVQLVSTVERQVFDFLGFMWAPIIGNFFQLFCVIIGLFGTCQYRPRFIIVYCVWSLLWLGWNLFVICIYLEVGVLRRDKELYILTIGTKTKSWWLEHGVGCTVTNTSWQNDVTVDSSRPIPPEEFVDGCILQYYYVEVIHAAVQCLLSLLGFVVSCVTIYAYTEEEESFDIIHGKDTNPSDLAVIRASYMQLQPVFTDTTKI